MNWTLGKMFRSLLILGPLKGSPRLVGSGRIPADRSGCSSRRESVGSFAKRVNCLRWVAPGLLRHLFRSVSYSVQVQAW